MKAFIKKVIAHFPGIKNLLNKYYIINEKITRIEKTCNNNGKMLKEEIQLENNNKEIILEMAQEIFSLKEMYKRLQETEQLHYESIKSVINIRSDETSKAIVDEISCGNNKIYQETKQMLSTITRATNESVWGEVYHDAVQESAWLMEKKYFLDAGL